MRLLGELLQSIARLEQIILLRSTLLCKLSDLIDEMLRLQTFVPYDASVKCVSSRGGRMLPKQRDARCTGALLSAQVVQGLGALRGWKAIVLSALRAEVRSPASTLLSSKCERSRFARL